METLFLFLVRIHKLIKVGGELGFGDIFCYV
jgi:hypothetical protein